MSDYPKLSDNLDLNEFGTHIQIPNEDKWYRLIYFDEDDQHLEFFDEEEKVILSSNELTASDIRIMYFDSPEFERDGN